MKRCISLLVILAMLAVPALAAAPEIDLTAMTYEELTAHRSAVEMEIMSRPEFKEAVVPGGMFYVGVDIPAGRYEIRPKAKGIYMYSFNVKKSEKDTFGTSYWLGTAYDTDRQVVTLKEGQILDLTNGAVIISPYKGIFGE